MVGIWETGLDDELRREVETAFDAATENIPPNIPIEIAPLVGTMELDRQIVTGEWGNGTATRGDDIELLLSVTFDESPIVNPEEDENFPEARAILSEALEDGFNDFGEISEELETLFGDFSFSIVHKSNERENINLRIGRGAGNSVYDLTNGIILRLTEGGDIVRDIPEEQIEEDEDEVGEDEEVEQAIVEISQEEIIRREFPDLPEEMIQFFDLEAEDLEIPVGKKNTKAIEREEPYPFEREMAEPGVVVSSSLNQQVVEGIGAAAANNFSSSTPATFPLTGLYIRNRLLTEGPAYILELYNDLVFYSGFISGKYGYNLRPGKYVAFREYIWRLNEIPERGGPRLIVPIPARQAEARGLSTMPVIDTGEEEIEAPWLEARQYYEINEDEADNLEVWRNPTEYLYEELTDG